MRRMVLSAALVASLLVAALLVAGTPALARQGDSSRAAYRPPVDAPIVDPFRPPAEPWAPGNRGVEYATAPGTPVTAAADGEVVFAGAVAGGLHVVVLHPDGVRTSYSFLQSMAVHRGDRVTQGQAVGSSGERLHFGARLGDAYIDPAQLFEQGPPEVYLVPEEVKRPGSEDGERKGIVDMLEGFTGDLLEAGADGLEWAAEANADAIDWARKNGAAAAQWAGDAALTTLTWSGETSIAVGEWAWHQLAEQGDIRLRELRALWHYFGATKPIRIAERLLATLPQWWNQRDDCTPSSVATPTPGRGHVAVLVSGFGSKSDEAAVYDVNTMALGYHPADVVRFSYRGGTTADNSFSADDTTVDIRQSGRRLYDLLERLAAEHPGMPIDIVAHSQGGLVVRSAMAYEADRSPSRPPVHSIVTLASPHTGTDIATAGTMLQETNGGQALAAGVDVVWHDAMDGPSVKSTSVHQMAEVSRFLRGLNHRPLPSGVHVTSIGAQGDYVVPAGHAELRGANNITVPVFAGNPHDALPGSTEAYREIALGLDGRAPSCQSLPDMLTDSAVSETISWAEDSVGASLWLLSQSTTGPSPVHPDDPGGEP